MSKPTNRKKVAYDELVKLCDEKDIPLPIHYTDKGVNTERILEEINILRTHARPIEPETENINKEDNVINITLDIRKQYELNRNNALREAFSLDYGRDIDEFSDTSSDSDQDSKARKGKKKKDKVKEYIQRFNEKYDELYKDNVILNWETWPRIKQMILEQINIIEGGLPPGDLKISIGILRGINEDKYGISVKFQTASLETLFNELVEKVETKLNEYLDPLLAHIPLYANEFFIRYEEVSAIIRSCRIAETIANDTWYIIDTKTKENCIFIASEVCRKWRKDIRYLTDHEYRIRKGIKCKNQGSEFKEVGTDQIYEFAMEQQINIIAYNNVFKKIEYKGSNLLEQYDKVEMQFSDNWDHVKPMIRRKDIREVYPEQIELISNVIKERILKENKFKRQYIRRLQTCGYKDDNYGTYDIETFNNNAATPYLIGLYTKKYGLVQFDGKNCVDEFLDYIKILGNYTLYGHNAGKFDIKCILDDILADKDFKVKKNPIFQEGCISALSAKYKDMFNMRTYNEIKFHDSYKIFSGSLKSLCHAFKVPTQKGVFDHDSVKGYLDEEDPLLEEAMKYNASDCIGLFECIEKFTDLIWKEYKINLTNHPSASSLSKRIFSTKYVKEREICLLTKEEDEKIRRGYRGGRTECFNIDLYENTKLYYYDFTSLYPSVGVMNLLPVGEPVLISEVTLDVILKDEKHVYFVDCIVKSPKDVLPVLPIYYNNKLVFPEIVNPTEMESVYSEELRMAKKMGYEITVKSAIQFKRGNPLKEFYTDLFNHKKNAEDDAIAHMWKIILNSGYGFFGLVVHNKQSLRISDSNLNERERYLIDDKLVNYNREYGYDIMLVEDDIKSNCINVAIAAAITALARCKLYNAMNDVSKYKGHVLYCDTDSIICDIPLEKHMKIGSELGMLKNELKTHHITNIMIAGPKVYWYKMNLISECKCGICGHTNKCMPNCKKNHSESSKLKGCSANDERKKEIIAVMLSRHYETDLLKVERLKPYRNNTTEPSNIQVSITSSVTMLMSEGERCNPIVRETKKNYRVYYDKGVLHNDGIVSPIRL